MTSDEPLPDRCGAECRDGSYCENYPVGDKERCRMHGGATPTKAENPDVGAPEGNTNATTHEAYCKSFVEDFLTDDEIERVEQAQEILGTPEGAQDHARLAASIAMEQYRRSGDERHLRRYEAICDKAGIFPDEELTVNMPGVEEALLQDVRQHHQKNR